MKREIKDKILAYANLRHFKFKYCLNIFRKATPEEKEKYLEEMDFAILHPEIKLGDPIIQLPN